jgi:hypothetical protein
MDLPRPPMFPVLRAGVPNANGRVYPPELIAKTLADAQQKVDNRTLLVYMPHEHGTPLEMRDVCGVVEHVDFDGTYVSVAIKFLHEHVAALANRLTFSTSGHGKLVDNAVTDYSLDGIIATASPARP